MPRWVPLPGPQTEAFDSPADILFYGGAAGGGKTDLLLGTALTRHTRSIIFRRESKQLQGIIERLTTIVGNRDGYNGQEQVWKFPEIQIELGSCKVPGDEIKYQGRPHDLIGFDEITHFLEKQFRFLLGWLRTTKAGQRCRVICTGNPPTDSDGQWVVEFWGPWLNPDHPNPARPGELRYYVMIGDKEVEVPDRRPVRHDGQIIIPKSRTFIPSKVRDNPFLIATGYESTLQALPEPLRSQMLRGDFRAGTDDDPYQVIPTEWVKLAQERWNESGKQGEMDSMGVDPARGGKCETVLATRYGSWYAPLICYPGSSTPDGPAVGALAISNLRDAAPIHVDVVGVGSSVYDHLNLNKIHVVGINGAEKSTETDRSGKLGFYNKRAEGWWRFREALDPQYGKNIALPPGNDVRADLCAPRWRLTTRGILIESKEELMSRIGRSPDKGDAIIYASEETPKLSMSGALELMRGVGGSSPSAMCA